MSDGRNNPGMSALADVMSAGINNEKGMDKVLDFGEILWDGSLLCNTYKVCVPKECYMVCRNCALPNQEVITSYSETAKNNSHKHKFEGMLEGVSDTQSSPDAHAHTVQSDLEPLETKGVTVTQKPHAHEVDIARPSQPHLQPGDHVLVAWVGYDACVIDIIVPASQALVGIEAPGRGD